MKMTTYTSCILMVVFLSTPLNSFISNKVVNEMQLSNSVPVGRHRIPTATADSASLYSNDVAMARFIVHQADWTSISTTSVIPNIKGYPFTSIVSMSDGTVEKSTGVPYFYLTPLDFPSIDLQEDSRCSISASLLQGRDGYCQSRQYAPDDPRCGRVMMSGRMERLQNGTAEHKFAIDALFSRHPSMAHLPKDHGFYAAKLSMEQILMFDKFGGAANVSVCDYLLYKNVNFK